MPSPILARADALMQRRRATAPDGEDLPILTDAVGFEDDFPVLLDIDHPSPASPPEPEPSAAPARLEGAVLDIVSHELSRRIQERLAAELPALIEATVRDFLAEREKLASLQADAPDQI